MQQQERRVVRVMPYTTKQLTAIYGVDHRTLKKWMNNLKESLGERNGYYWSIPQVRLIFEKLSLPANIILEP